MVWDVTRAEDNACLADTAIERFGGIDLVAPFAGIIQDGLLLSTDFIHGGLRLGSKG